MSAPKYALVLAAIWMAWPLQSRGDDLNSQQIALCSSTDPTVAIDTKLSACSNLIASNATGAPDLAIIYNSRGSWYFMKKAYKLAIDDFTSAIRIDSTYAFAYNNRGLAYRHLGRFEEAVADFDRADRRNESPVHYINLAETFAYIGDKSKVITNLEKARDQLPNSLEVYYATCLSMALLGDSESPVSECNEAIRITPDDPNVHDVRGYANQRAGNFQAAIRDYSDALRLNPELDSSLFGRGVAYLELGNSAAGRIDLAKARQVNPSIDKEMALDHIMVPANF